jgi:hypothetical protein
MGIDCFFRNQLGNMSAGRDSLNMMNCGYPEANLI